MPNHIHLILYFEKENKLSEYMRDFKKFTSTHIRKQIQKEGNQGVLEKIRYRHRAQHFKIWMDRIEDVVIRSTKILLIKLRYIHHNPVRKDLVPYPDQYLHSSAGFYMKDLEPKITLLHFSEII